MAHKLFQVLVLGGSALVGCTENAEPSGSDAQKDAETPIELDASNSIPDSNIAEQLDSGTSRADDAGRATTADTGIREPDAGAVNSADAGAEAAPCFCPDETCSDEGGCANPGFYCCWGTPEGC